MDSLASIIASLADLPAADVAAMDAARARDAVLTKPAGSLGRLEELAVWYKGWRAATALQSVRIVIFAGNHGVTRHGVSAYPSDVTVEMVKNFTAGGAAINQLAKSVGATLSVTPLELDRPTADMTAAPAMSDTEFAAAFKAGAGTVDATDDLIAIGEMGIGNTTAAAAIATALFGGGAARWTGRGTGVDDAGHARKVTVIEQAVACHRESVQDSPLEALRCLGGRELAAMAGAVVAARQARIPVLVDGFVASAAVAPLQLQQPGALDHCQFAHVSAEPGHRRLLDHLRRRALLDLDLRLGEASGAALAVPLVRAALAVHHGMASFAEAGVSTATAETGVSE